MSNSESTQRIVITGSSSGFGLFTAKSLLTLGYEVSGSDLKKSAAWYGQAQWHLSDALGLTTGVRAMDAIGIHAVFGGFLLGAVLPRGPLTEKLREQLQPFVVIFLAALTERLSFLVVIAVAISFLHLSVTMGSLSLTASKLAQRRGFGPFVPGVFHAPYANCYRCPVGNRPDTCA